jgi:hypothetical protein
MQRSRFCRLLARPVFVRVMLMGESFSTASQPAKNFGDWILNFSGLSRQVKMTPKKNACILNIHQGLQEIHFSTP